MWADRCRICGARHPSAPCEYCGVGDPLPTAELLCGTRVRRRRWPAVAATLVVLAILNYAPKAIGSIFGEENVTLAQILVQMTQSKEVLSDISSTAGEIADDTQSM